MADLGRLDELKRKFDENPRRYFAPLANEYRKAGDPERAIELCRTYLPQQPNHMSGYIVYGQALHDGGRSDEATAVFKQALTLDPENIIALRHLGEIAQASGDKAAAMRWFGKVLELDPRNEEIAGYITALASPSATPMPQSRPTPPPIRPEPDPDPGAVALADVLRQPDRPSISRPEARAAEPAATEDAPASAQGDEELALPNGTSDVDTAEFEAFDWHTAAAPLTPQSAADDDDSPIGAIGPEGRIDTQSAPESDHHEAWAPSDSEFTVGDEASGEPPLTVERSPFVTETMAELYMQQGLDGEALAIYRQLSETRADPHIAARIAELEDRVAEAAEATAASGFGSRYDREIETELEDPPIVHAQPPASAPAAHAVGESVREFFARIGSADAGQIKGAAAAETASPRRGLDTLFGGDANPDDMRAARSLAGAFGAPNTSGS